jgi:tetratricopeptide (TPR) repeat protein
MTTMKNLFVSMTAALLITGAAVAQDFPSDQYEFLQAKLAAAEGRFDDALTMLDKVIQKNPADAVLRYERASILADAGRLDRAEAELRKVVELKGDFYDARRLLGRMLLERAGNDRTRVEEALTHLSAAFKLNPDDLGTGMAVSQILQSSGRLAEAEKVLGQMLERAPDQRALNYNYALVLTKLGRGGESKQYLERAVLLDPAFGPAVMQLVDIYQKENDWKKAADVLQPLIDQDPMNLDLQRQQAYFYLRSGNPEQARASFRTIAEADPKDTRSRFYLAEALSDLQQFAEADKIYRTLLEETPNDPDVLASFGLSQSTQKNFAEAKKTFGSLLAVKDVPENLQTLARTQLAYIAMQEGRYDEAISGARQVLIFNDKPNSQAINIALEALKKQKKEKEAVELLQPLVDKFGSDPFVNARYVEMLVRSGDKEKAKLMAATQVKLGSRNAIATAEAYIQAGDHTSAIALLREALKSRPDDLDLNFSLGSAYERAGDKKSAEQTFLAILKAHPEHAGTLNYLGYMWAEEGVNLDRAAEMLTRAVTQEPRNGAFIDSLGWVYYRQGKLELAEKYLTDATRLLPRDATVHEHLGDVFAKRGDLVRALSLYKVALGLEPEAKDEAKLRTKIAELEKQSQNAQRR